MMQTLYVSHSPTDVNSPNSYHNQSPDNLCVYAVIHCIGILKDQRPKLISASSKGCLKH